MFLTMPSFIYVSIKRSLMFGVTKSIYQNALRKINPIRMTVAKAISHSRARLSLAFKRYRVEK